MYRVHTCSYTSCPSTNSEPRPHQSPGGNAYVSQEITQDRFLEQALPLASTESVTRDWVTHVRSDLKPRVKTHRGSSQAGAGRAGPGRHEVIRSAVVSGTPPDCIDELLLARLAKSARPEYRNRARRSVARGQRRTRCTARKAQGTRRSHGLLRHAVVFVQVFQRGPTMHHRPLAASGSSGTSSGRHQRVGHDEAARVPDRLESGAVLGAHDAIPPEREKTITRVLGPCATDETVGATEYGESRCTISGARSRAACQIVPRIATARWLPQRRVAPMKQRAKFGFREPKWAQHRRAQDIDRACTEPDDVGIAAFRSCYCHNLAYAGARARQRRRPRRPPHWCQPYRLRRCRPQVVALPNAGERGMTSIEERIAIYARLQQFTTPCFSASGSITGCAAADTAAAVSWATSCINTRIITASDCPGHFTKSIVP